MGMFSSRELGILREFINLVVNKCLEKILEYHKDIDDIHLKYRYAIEDFHPKFRLLVRESIEAYLDRAIEFPDVLLTPGSEWSGAFDSIENLAEKVAVQRFYAKGKDEFRFMSRYDGRGLLPKKEKFRDWRTSTFSTLDIHQGLADDIAFVLNGKKLD